MQRAFDPAFREAARGALAGLPFEELKAREGRDAPAGLGPLVLGGGSPDLIHRAVPPCRLLDTRAGAPLAPGTPRNFRATGTGLQGQGGEPLGCGLPVGGATAAVINFVAVNPAGPGNLRAWAYSEPRHRRRAS